VIRERAISVGKGKRSLVLVTVDCLRADHCGLYGYTRSTTPFLDSMAAESFVVPQAIVAGVPTYYSFPALFASRMPLALGRDVVGLAPGENTLATTLHNSGYATAAFSAANPYLSARFGYEQGFEVFLDFLDSAVQPAEKVEYEPACSDSVRGKSNHKLNQSIRKIAGKLGLSSLYEELYFEYRMKATPVADNIDALRRYPAADVLVDQAQSWLATVTERPFFLWLHLMDPHSPYYPPAAALRELTGKDIEPSRARYLNEYWNRSDLPVSSLRKRRNEVVELYDAGIRNVDRQIARLVDGLRQTHQWDDCVFVLTADHGEEFLDHGGRYHAPVHLGEELIRVPLVIRVPEERAKKPVPSSPMSHLHLAPTLLEILGVRAPSSFRGRSLWSGLQQGVAWSDPAIVECTYNCRNPFRAEGRNAPRLLGVRDGRFKLVIRIEPGGTEEVYDLETDAAEMHPKINEIDDETRKRLLQVAREHIGNEVSSRDAVMRLQARLRDLRSELVRA
jgi:arylsulfatase A-like enzyme